jgi:hypothetical protein
MRLALRYCLPRVRRKGYGLGNELLPWARAFLAAQVLGIPCLPPAFGLNRRGYWRHFGTATDDWLRNRALERLLPVVNFTQADWLNCGGGDVVPALHRFADAHGLRQRKAYLLVTEGLWGGWQHVQAAREFIRSTLYQSRFAAANLLRLGERLDARKLLIAMHVRLGDFAASGAAEHYREAANRSLPLNWFRDIALTLRQRLGEQLQFLLISDGEPAQLRALMDEVPCVTSGDIPDGDCSDLLALASADLLLCSTSTYSSLAAFLSDAPYLWFAPNLAGNWQGRWLGERAEELQRPGSALRSALESLSRDPGSLPRGIPVDVDAKLPEWLWTHLQQRQALRRSQTDLVRGGVAPPAASPPAAAP